MPRSAKALWKVFLERHKQWEACNNPQGYETGEVRKASDKRHAALMNLVRRGQEIRTAPKGKLRIVYTDTDTLSRIPTRHGDYKNMASVRSALDHMAQTIGMKVYDDEGKEVVIGPPWYPQI